MKDGDGQIDSSSSVSAAAAAVSTAVGPLRVVSSTSKDKLAPPNLISSRGSHHRDEIGSDADDQRPNIDADEDDGDDDDTDTDDSHDGGGGRQRGGVVMSDDEGGGKQGHGDVDAPGLGSFSTMGAVIGDFSPQFKFSFTDEIHLDLGGGLKVGGWYSTRVGGSGPSTERKGTRFVVRNTPPPSPQAHFSFFPTPVCTTTICPCHLCPGRIARP